MENKDEPNTESGTRSTASIPQSAIRTPQSSAPHSDILIVEDSQLEAEMLRRILVRAGYLVHAVAKNGEEGLRVLREHPCALVMSDINMPIMDGYELCHAIKLDDKLWSIPVILVTSLSEPQDIIRALDVGADGYITKPYIEDILLGRIRSLLNNPVRRKLAEERRKIQVEYGGEKHNVAVDSPQMANLLLSVYENSLILNQELMRIQNQLTVLNETLDEKVHERTAALQKSEQRYRQIIQTSMDGFCVIDTRGRILVVNDAYCQLSGYAREELLNMSIPDVEAKEAPEQMARHIPEATTQGRTRFETLHRRKDGQLLSIEVSAVYLPDTENGQFFVFLRDITERKRAEQEIHQFNAELEQRVHERTAQLEIVNADLEGFSYSVSHDLRAPLRAIDGFVSILREDYGGKLDNEGQRLLQVVCDNARKMGQLIDDILAFSRAGRAEFQVATLDMNALVQQVWLELEPQLEGRAIEFRATDLPATRGDHAALHQVWQNLLGNAVKFTRGREVAQIEVEGHREANETVYSIRDNGAGFDMAYIDKLFCLFQRLHSAKEFEGTGVGLSISKRFIAKHGGRVWAEGKVGEGATFWFTLPADER